MAGAGETTAVSNAEIPSIPDTADSAPSFTDDPAPSPSVDLIAQWPAFMEKLMHDRPGTGSLLAVAHTASFTGTTLDLRFPPEHQFQYSEITRRANREIVTGKIREFAGAQIDVHITLEKGTPGNKRKSYAETVRDSQPSIQGEIEREPIISAVLKKFNGEVIE